MKDDSRVVWVFTTIKDCFVSTGDGWGDSYNQFGDAVHIMVYYQILLDEV